MRRVIVEIDRLVLAGIEREDAHSIAEGLRRELARVFGDREAVAHLRSAGEVPRLQVRGLRLEHGFGPQRIAEGVAQGIRRETGK